MACGAHKERKKERKKEKIATQLHLQCKTFNNNLIHVILGSANL
jgi:ribosomal protein S11